MVITKVFLQSEPGNSACVTANHHLAVLDSKVPDEYAHRKGNALAGGGPTNVGARMVGIPYHSRNINVPVDFQ